MGARVLHRLPQRAAELHQHVPRQPGQLGLRGPEPGQLRPRTALLLAALGLVVLVAACTRRDEHASSATTERSGDAAARLVSGEPVDGLTASEASTFVAGRDAFAQAWEIAQPPSTSETLADSAHDGLGPTFNASSCVSCHVGHGAGSVPTDTMDERAGLVLRLSVPGTGPDGSPAPEPAYGDQLQDHATGWAPHEGRFLQTFTEVDGTYADGSPYSLRRPTVTIGDLQFGPMAADTMTSVRLAPPVFGLGLLEAIPAAEITARADPDDLDHDGISGRPNWVWNPATSATDLGRFGWKAGVASVAQQTSIALLADSGVTSASHPVENCPGPQVDCRAAPSGGSDGSPEATADTTTDIAFYTRTIAVPTGHQAPETTGGDVGRGEELFAQSGCASCHTPRSTTGDSDVVALAHKTIAPYTDLLLHDMGAGLADGRPEYTATGSEWRTAPLWGVGIQLEVNPASGFLHDGRARTLAEAILWHGGEAEPARERFRSMPADDRAALLAFLGTL